LHKKSDNLFAQRTNLIAGGNATGSESLMIRRWKGRISIRYCSTLSEGAQQKKEGRREFRDGLFNLIGAVD
jgi:hypothetical protein